MLGCWNTSMAPGPLVLLVILLGIGQCRGLSLHKRILEEIHDNIKPLKAALFPSEMADEALFYILSYYSPVDAVSERCRNDSNMYVEAVLNYDLWALQMFDASSKLQPGSLVGNLQGLGSFDGCLDVSTSTFIGQHCVVEILDDRFPNIQKLRKSNNSKTYFPIQPLDLMVSVCVPSSCTPEDVETHWKTALGPLNASARVTSRQCSTRAPEEMENKDYVAIFVLLTLLGLVLSASINDYISCDEKKDKRHSILSSFSLYKSISLLNKETNNKELSCLHGIRFLAAIWMVMGHRFLITYSIPSFNYAILEYYLEHWSAAIVLSSTLSTEIFLLIAGLVVTYGFLSFKRSNKTFNIPMFYLKKYIRITPAFAVMMLVDGVLLYHFSSGPIWKMLSGQHRDNCSSNWLPGLLYISNYIHFDCNSNIINFCVMQSWFLNTYMQLFLLSPLLLVPLHKKPKIGLLLIFTCFFGMIFASFTNAYFNKLKSGYLLTVTRKTEKNFSLDYTATHVRSASYFLGMALGYYIFIIKEGKVKFSVSKPVRLLVWVFSTALMVSIVFSFVIFQAVNGDTPQVVDSLHIALHRPLFSLGVSWFILMCITGYGGFVNKFLSMPVMKVFGTLAYGIFLTHFTLQVYQMNRVKVPLHFTRFNFVTLVVSDVVISLFTAFLLFVLVEAPFSQLFNRFLSKENQKEDKESHAAPNNTEF